MGGWIYVQGSYKKEEKKGLRVDLQLEIGSNRIKKLGIKHKSSRIEKRDFS